MPAFLLLVLFEKWYGWYKGRDTVRNMDMISSLCSGVTNVTKDVLGLAIALISYEWLVSHVALTHINTSWYTYLIVFIVLDFAGYTVHAIDHKINFFWNSHIIHHSSEEFNLACALRQSVSVFVRLFVILLIPAALLGIDSSVIAIEENAHRGEERRGEVRLGMHRFRFFFGSNQVLCSDLNRTDGIEIDPDSNRST